MRSRVRRQTSAADLGDLLNRNDYGKANSVVVVFTKRCNRNVGVLIELRMDSIDGMSVI